MIVVDDLRRGKRVVRDEVVATLLRRADKRHSIVGLNNLNSFTGDVERAWEVITVVSVESHLFGQYPYWIVSVKAGS